MYLGLDLSLRKSGVCVISSRDTIDFIGTVETEPQEELPGQRFERYKYIMNTIKGFISEFDLKVVAIENYSLASKGHIVQLVESGSLVRNMIFEKFLGVHIIEVAPIALKKFILGGSDAKKATGEDAKQIMCREVYKTYDKNINGNNKVDAFLLAQVALLYDSYKRSEELAKKVYHKYQIEVVQSIIKKEIEEIDRIEKLKKKKTS